MKLSLLPLRATLRAAALVLVAGPLLAPLAAMAQSAPPKAQPAAAATKPASVEEVNTYMTMSAINLCALSQQKVPFKAALDGSVSMVASVLTEKHGSRLAGAANPLSRDQIINATVAESILRSDRFCGSRLPADWRKEYDTLLPQIRKALAPGAAKPAGSK
ncbi:MAG: hypothetical protein ACKOZW_05685 [Cyanobium sp.]